MRQLKLREIANLILVSAFLSAALYVLESFSIYQVAETSMEQTLHDGDWLLVRNKDGLLPAPLPQRGDIIVFYDSYDKSTAFVKRVVACGGDTVNVADGTLVPHEFTPGHRLASFQPKSIDLPAGHYFVMGDNRDFSLDSRTLGAVLEQDIAGTVAYDLTSFHRPSQSRSQTVCQDLANVHP